MHHPILFFPALRLSVQWFQMPLESVVKTLTKFDIINATDLLLQSITSIICPR